MSAPHASSRRVPAAVPVVVAAGAGTLALLVPLAAGWTHPLVPVAGLLAAITAAVGLAGFRQSRSRSADGRELPDAAGPSTAAPHRGRTPPPAPAEADAAGEGTPPRAGGADAGDDRRNEVLARVRSGLARDLDLFLAAVEGVVRASGEAAENTATMASAVEELSASIGEIGRNAATSAEIARRAVGEMADTTEAIRRTHEATARIGRFVEAIREVTERTKILALNATIEAARAGAAGRGFAVVAQEVKALAHRVDEIAAEIGEAARGIESGVRDACDRAAVITESLAESEGATAAIAGAVEQQHAVVRDLSERLHGIARAARELERMLDGGDGDAGLRPIAARLARTRDELARLLREEEGGNPGGPPLPPLRSTRPARPV